MNTTTIEIFHNIAENSIARCAGLLGYQPQHPVRKVFTFTLPADEPADVHALAEHAYRVGNGDDPLSGAYYRLARRSMSVGDLVRLNGLVWLSCASTGFSLLTHWPLVHVQSDRYDVPAGILAANTIDITELAAAADTTDNVPRAVRLDQPAASAGPAVHRYGATLERLRQLITREAADDISDLISELPALRAAAHECSQTTTRGLEKMFKVLLSVRRIQTVQSRHDCGGRGRSAGR
ncbi:hypothetical protein [Actinomadura violacea]|uniref:Uncharacterized protein n=1 Tax=Actinomadura violacea TaxID=2819934 RepID=A0ABS3S9R4_9ACTN|nr:hypothetical protein [Actinomadura violacea]MBO2464964.1 hypothetical protein [Actinomadura violacea]